MSIFEFTCLSIRVRLQQVVSSQRSSFIILISRDAFNFCRLKKTVVFSGLGHEQFVTGIGNNVHAGLERWAFASTKAKKSGFRIPGLLQLSIRASISDKPLKRQIIKLHAAPTSEPCQPFSEPKCVRSQMLFEPDSALWRLKAKRFLNEPYSIRSNEREYLAGEMYGGR